MVELMVDLARGDDSRSCACVSTEPDRRADAPGVAETCAVLRCSKPRVVGGEVLPVDALATLSCPLCAPLPIHVNRGRDEAAASTRRHAAEVRRARGRVTLRLWLDPNGPDAEPPVRAAQRGYRPHARPVTGSAFRP